MTFSFAGGIKDVQKRKQSGISIPVTDGLFAYFDANNPNSYPGAGNIWRDLTSRKHVANVTTSIVGYNNRYGGHLVMSSDGTNTPATATTNLSGTNTVTLMAWINPNAVQNSWAGIIMDRAGTFSGMQFDGSGGTKLSFMWNTLHYTFDTGITVPANKWSLVSIVVTPTTITPYLNGTAGNVLTSTLAVQSFTQFRLGWDNGAARVFQGKYGAAMIYNKSLSAAEVSSMYDFFKTRYVVADNSLQLHYDLADSACYSGSGTTLNDLSGNGKTTTLTNGPVYTTDNGGCLTFDGVNDYLTSVSISNPNGQLTCELVMDYNNTGAYHNIFDNNSTRPMLWIDNNGKLEASFASSGNPSGLTSPLAYNNQKVVVTAVYNSGSAPGIQLYVNGSSIGTNSNLQPTWSNPSTFTLFNRSNSQTFNGKLYSLKFYNKALTSQEVSQNYAAIKQNFYPTNFPASISNLEVWLKADSGVYDANKALITADNTAVAAWDDFSGSNKNFVQTNSARRPVLRTGANGVNGIPAIQFDGSDDVLQGIWSNYNTNQPYTTFTVVNYSTFNDYCLYQYGFNGNTGTSGDSARLLNSSGKKYRIFGDTAGWGDSDAVAPSSGTVLLTIQHNGVVGGAAALVVARHNGQEIYRTTLTRSAPATGNTQNVMTIGSFILPDNTLFMPFNGKICEHLYFSKVLNDKEIKMVEAYLNAKWDCYKFNPSDISNLALWVDADDASTLYQSGGGSLAAADGDVVGAWLDKSGNGRHMTQATAGNKPILKKNQLNGKQMVRGDGVDDRLQQLAVAPNYIVNSTCTIFAVIKQVSTKAAAQQRPMGNTNGGVGTNGFNLITSANTGAPNYWVVRDSSGSGAGDITMTGTFTLGQAYVYTFRLNASGAQSFINGFQNVATTAITTLGTPTQPFTLFQDGTPTATTFAANSDIGEVIVYSKSLTDQERISIENYLRRKWGI